MPERSGVGNSCPFDVVWVSRSAPVVEFELFGFESLSFAFSTLDFCCFCSAHWNLSYQSKRAEVEEETAFEHYLLVENPWLWSFCR